MWSQETNAYAKFGINELYFHKKFPLNLMDKLYQRAAFTLDAEDTVAQKSAPCDMILIFYRQVPSASLIYRFLKQLNQDANRERFIESNTLLNEDELFQAIKAKQFVLVTPRAILKAT